MTDPLVPISPDPQYVPRNFAHGAIPDRTSNIPSLCGYFVPNDQSVLNLAVDGYFGPAQTRPDVAVAGTVPPGGDYVAGTDSENQGQPSIGPTVAFGSLILWATSQDHPVPALLGYAVRINTGDGYGKEPALEAVQVDGLAWP